METSTNESAHQARSQTPTQDEEMAKIQPLAQLALTEEEMHSDMVDDSFHRKKGMFIQFINTGCPGTPPVFGGIRINCTDIRRAPAYLSRNRRLIKQHATRQLMKHFAEMQHCGGANESLSMDDFGMSFSVASVSSIGAIVNPGKRQEGPMFFCHYPALVETTPLLHADWNNGQLGESVHILNAHVSLLPTHLRRHVVIQKAKEEKAAAALVVSQPAPPPQNPQPAKKPKLSPQASTSNGATQRPTHNPQAPRPFRDARDTRDNNELRDEISALYAMVNRLQAQVLPSPPLPATKPLVWPSRDQGPDLPDDM